jgi:hypothetical protein
MRVARACTHHSHGLRRCSTKGEAALVMLSLPAEPQDDTAPASPSRSQRMALIDDDDDAEDGEESVLHSGGGKAAVVMRASRSQNSSGYGKQAVNTPLESMHRYPGTPGDSDAEVVSEGCTAYLELLEQLTEGLDRLILIRGGGKEVVTIFN